MTPCDIIIAGFKNNYFNRKIRDTLNGQHEIWIGLEDKHDEGVWRFLDGRVASNVILPWHGNEPNNYQGGQHCGIWKTYTKDQLGIDDSSCSRKYRALCQIPKSGCSI